MRRLTVNGIVAAIIAAAGFSVPTVQDWTQRGAGQERGPGPGGLRPAGLARFANLTDEQRQQVQAILEEARESRQGPPGAVVLHRQLQAEIVADMPDEQKIDNLRQQLIQAQSEALSHQIAVDRKIAQVLTPEQRAQVRERLAEAPARRSGRGERRPPRPPAF